MASTGQVTWEANRFKVLGLLHSHYTCVSSLKDYLVSIIDDQQCLENLQQDGDKPRYTSLLETLLVCHQGESNPPRFTSYDQLSHQEEIIVTVVARLQRTGQTKNLIAYGFSKSSGNVQSQASSSHQVECTYPSYTCSFLMSRPWKTLILRVGDEVIVHLLGSKSLFAFAEPSCYVQLTGIPVYELDTLSQVQTVHHLQDSTIKDKKQCFKEGRKNWVCRKKEAAINLLVKKVAAKGKSLDVCGTQVVNSSHVDEIVGIPCEQQGGQMHGFGKYADSGKSGKVLSTENVEIQDCIKNETVRSSITSQDRPAQKRPAPDMEPNTGMQNAKKRRLQYAFQNKACDAKRRVLQSLGANEERSISDPTNQLSVAKRIVLYGNCQHEGLGQKHFLRTMGTDEDSLKMLLSRIILDPPAKPTQWPSQKSFKSKDMAEPSLQPCSKDFIYMHAPRLVDGLRNFIKLNRKCNSKTILEQNCPLLCEAAQKDIVKTKFPQLTGPVYKRNRGNHFSQTVEHFEKGQVNRGACNTEPTVAGAPCSKHKVAAAAGQKKVMNKLLNCHYEPKKVYQWLRAVGRTVLPIRFWGAAQNQHTFLKILFKFVKAGKYEKLSTREMLHGIKVEKMPILGDFLSHSDREKVLMLLLHWLIVGFFMPLLKAYFYVTDSAMFRNRLFYYRKHAWSAIEKLAVEDSVRCCLFRPLTKAGTDHLLSQGALTVSSLRFMPKTDGVRPIVALNGNTAKSAPKDSVSVNKQLVNVFHLLTHIKNQDPSLVGCSVLGQNEIHTAWRQFTERRESSNDNRPLYFVKLDIEHCYNSMDQQLLFDIVSEYIKLHPEYVVRRFVKLVSDGGKAKRSFCRQVVPLVDLVPDPLQFAAKLQQGPAPLHDAILIDQVHHQTVSAESLLDKLTAHIRMNLVSVAGCEYLQIKGISQGSVLSPLLCAFYYGRMENEHLLKPEPAELLLRQVDDFLFVTPDINRAIAFLDTLLSGIPKFGCHVNTKKTLTSFPVPGRPQVACLSPKDLFPWCGLLLDTETLSVRADYTRYANLRCSDTLTFDTSQTPGQAIFTKLTRCAKLQFQSVLVDSAYNDTHTVIVNIYQMALLVAERFIYCERALPADRNATTNLPFFISTIFKLTSILTRLYQRKCSHVRSPPCLGDNQVRWVVLQAMIQTLAKSRSRHRRLESAISRHQRSISKHMTKEGIMWLRSVVHTVPLLAFLKD